VAATIAWLTPFAALALDDFAQKVTTDAAGNIYVTGASLTNTAGYDYITIVYNPGGAAQRILRYNNSK
jgi:hypothetical protein